MTHPQENSQAEANAHESGQGMLELALCLPILMLLVLGAAEIANIGWSSVQLNNAARAGAAFGSQSHADAADIADIKIAAQREAPNLTITFPNDPSQSCSCIDTTTGTTGSGSTGCLTLAQCPSPYVIFDNITVQVQAVVTPLVRYPGLPASYTLNAQATLGVLNK